MQSLGESLRLVMGVPSPNGCQVALLAVRPELWTNSLGTCIMALLFKGKKGSGDSDMLMTGLFCMAVASQEDQEAPSLPLQSLSHLQQPMSSCVVPVPNHSPAKRRMWVSPAHTHTALRWVPARVSLRLTPGTREPKNGVKNYNFQYLKPKLGLRKEL